MIFWLKPNLIYTFHGLKAVAIEPPFFTNSFAPKPTKSFFINCHGLQAVDKGNRIGLAKHTSCKMFDEIKKPEKLEDKV